MKKEEEEEEEKEEEKGGEEKRNTKRRGGEEDDDIRLLRHRHASTPNSMTSHDCAGPRAHAYNRAPPPRQAAS